MNQRTAVIVLISIIGMHFSAANSLRMLDVDNEAASHKTLFDYKTYLLTDIPKYDELVEFIEVNNKAKLDTLRRIIPEVKFDSCTTDNPNNTKEIIDLLKSSDKLISDFNSKADNMTDKLNAYLIQNYLLDISKLEDDKNKVSRAIQALKEKAKSSCDKANKSLEEKNAALLIKGSKAALDQINKNKAEIEKNNNKSKEENIVALPQLKESEDRFVDLLNEKYKEVGDAYKRAQQELTNVLQNSSYTVNNNCLKIKKIRADEDKKKKADEKKKADAAAAAAKSKGKK